MMEWDNGYRDGYAKGVSDAVNAINKIGKADYDIWTVIVELLDNALQETTGEAL